MRKQQEERHVVRSFTLRDELNQRLVHQAQIEDRAISRLISESVEFYLSYLSLSATDKAQKAQTVETVSDERNAA